MINYELAKKLKDAGFLYDWCGDEGFTACYEVHQPGLSELIEACFQAKYEVRGEFELKEHLGVWHTSIYVGGTAIRIFAEGKTPEEAVANLWIELNKK